MNKLMPIYSTGYSNGNGTALKKIAMSERNKQKKEINKQKSTCVRSDFD